MNPFTLFFCHFSTWKNNCSDRVHSLSLSVFLPLRPRLPHFLSSLPLSWIQRESHCLNQMCHKLVRWCLFSVPFPYLCVCFNSVYIFDKVLWHSPHSHINRMKFCSVITEIGIFTGGGVAAILIHKGVCDSRICMFRQLVSIFVKTISKQPFHWSSLETLNKGYFPENKRCLRDWTAVFLPPKV